MELTGREKIWAFPPSDTGEAEGVRALVEATGLSTVTCTILYRRGHRTRAAVRSFLSC
jgi:hypothetical protein